MTKRQHATLAPQRSKVVPGHASLPSASISDPRRPKSRPLTIALWLANSIALGVGAILATLFALMPVSLDLNELWTAGTAPWLDAAEAVGLFAVQVVAVVTSLVVWHRTKLKTLPWLLAAGAITGAGYIAWLVERDWF